MPVSPRRPFQLGSSGISGWRFRRVRLLLSAKDGRHCVRVPCGWPDALRRKDISLRLRQKEGIGVPSCSQPCHRPSRVVDLDQHTDCSRCSEQARRESRKQRPCNTGGERGELCKFKLEARPVAGDRPTRQLATEPVNDVVKKQLKRVARWASQCAFPNDEDAPAQAVELSDRGRIVCAVVSQLLVPKFGVSGRKLEHRAAMCVPETAMHKNGRAMPRKDDIRRARQVLAVKAEPQASRV